MPALSVQALDSISLQRLAPNGLTGPGLWYARLVWLAVHGVGEPANTSEIGGRIMLARADICAGVRVLVAAELVTATTMDAGHLAGVGARHLIPSVPRLALDWPPFEVVIDVRRVIAGAGARPVALYATWLALALAAGAYSAEVKPGQPAWLACTTAHVRRLLGIRRSGGTWSHRIATLERLGLVVRWKRDLGVVCSSP